MSWRAELEDRYTVECIACGHETIDTERAPNQRYARGTCSACGHNHVAGRRKPALPTSRPLEHRTMDGRLWHAVYRDGSRESLHREVYLICPVSDGVRLDAVGQISFAGRSSTDDSYEPWPNGQREPSAARPWTAALQYVAEEGKP